MNDITLCSQFIAKGLKVMILIVFNFLFHFLFFSSTFVNYCHH